MTVWDALIVVLYFIVFVDLFRGDWLTRRIERLERRGR